MVELDDFRMEAGLEVLDMLGDEILLDGPIVSGALEGELVVFCEALDLLFLLEELETHTHFLVGVIRLRPRDLFAQPDNTHAKEEGSNEVHDGPL